MMPAWIARDWGPITRLGTKLLSHCVNKNWTHYNGFLLKACLHLPPLSLHPSASLSKFNIASMKMDRWTIWQTEWVQNPFWLSNWPSPYTQCKFDGDGDRHRNKDGTCKQALRIVPTVWHSLCCECDYDFGCDRRRSRVGATLCELTIATSLQQK